MEFHLSYVPRKTFFLCGCIIHHKKKQTSVQLSQALIQLRSNNVMRKLLRSFVWNHLKRTTSCLAFIYVENGGKWFTLSKVRAKLNANLEEIKLKNKKISNQNNLFSYLFLVSFSSSQSTSHHLYYLLLSHLLLPKSVKRWIHFKITATNTSRIFIVILIIIKETTI